MSFKQKILLGLAVFAIFIQFFRPKKNAGPESSFEKISADVHASIEVATILKNSCYDCHSNHTKYLWYHEIMPVGWFVNHHIEEGKEHLNFETLSSLPTSRRDHKLEEIAEEVAEYKMPTSDYILLHPHARLEKSQMQAIINWSKSLKIQ